MTITAINFPPTAFPPTTFSPTTTTTTSRSTGDIRVEGGSEMLGGWKKWRREDDLSDGIQKKLRRLGGERSVSFLFFNMRCCGMVID